MILIRMGIVETLHDAGCETIEVEQEAAALSLIAHRPDITVLFSDIGASHPHDGIWLAHQTHATNPGIQIILTSGRAAPAEADMPPGTWFVPKPYCALDMAKRISVMNR